MTDPNENCYEHLRTDQHYTFYLTTFDNYSVGDAQIYAVGMTLSALEFVTLSDYGYCPLKVHNFC
jgi:ABC-type xylose transport system substrate-binding protein